MKHTTLRTLLACLFLIGFALLVNGDPLQADSNVLVDGGFSVDVSRNVSGFAMALDVANSFDSDDDDLYDYQTIRFSLANTTGACYHNVEVFECGTISRFVADLGCPNPDPGCPDPNACGYSEFRDLHQCNSGWIWGSCVNAGEGLNQFANTVSLGGMPNEMGTYGPHEVWFFTVDVTGWSNLVHYLFSLQVDGARDADCDYVLDEFDNCISVENPDQIDADDDGFGAACECDDLDPEVNPDAIEICTDGIDNDCDGLIDGHDTWDCPTDIFEARLTCLTPVVNPGGVTEVLVEIDNLTAQPRVWDGTLNLWRWCDEYFWPDFRHGSRPIAPNGHFQAVLRVPVPLNVPPQWLNCDLAWELIVDEGEIPEKGRAWDFCEWRIELPK